MNTPGHGFRNTVRGVGLLLAQTDLGDDQKTVREHYSRWVPERQARLNLIKILKDTSDDKPKPKLVAIRTGALERR